MTWETAASGSQITRALLFEMETATTTIRVHDGVGPISWQPPTSDEAEIWGGIGQLGAVSGISGGVDLDASDVTVGITGIPSDLRDEVLQEVMRGKPARIYQGLRDEASGTWSFEPELVFSGFVDAPEVDEEIQEDLGAYLIITVPIIAASSYVRRITTWRRTDADQQELFAGDKFFSFKTDMKVPVPTTGSNGRPNVYPGRPGGRPDSHKPV